MLLELPDSVQACPATLLLIVRALAGALPRGCYDDAWDAVESAAPGSYRPARDVENWMREHWPALLAGDDPAADGAVITPDYPVSPTLARAWMPVFLDVFISTGGNATKAAAAANVHERTPYKAREADKTFAEAWEWAERKVADAIRGEIYRRAVEGWEEPQFGILPGKGSGEGVIGVVRRFDTPLLIKMATARVPEYRTLVKEGAAQVSATATASAEASSNTVKVTEERLVEIHARTQRRLQRKVDGARPPVSGLN